MEHADAVLASKLALEREIMVPLYRALSAYIMAWARSDGAVTVFERAGHQRNLEDLLERHYARVALAMRGRKAPKGARIEDAALSLDHAQSLRARVQAQARRYLDSTDAELRTLHTQSQGEVKASSSGRGGGFTVLQQGTFKTTAEQAHAKARRRARNAANVETQETAEEARFEWVKQNKANARIVKIWHNMGDTRVRGNPAGRYRNSRFDHWTVEGQERFVDQPFDISGEQLMHPGDTSKGATLGNVVNCRCSAQFMAVHNDGRREEIGLEVPHVPAKRTWHPGDRLGKETPVNPTSLVTLNGRTRARIVLGDGHTFATLRQTTPSTIEIVVGRQVVARASTAGEEVTSITIASGWEAQGMETLIRDSVRHSARREWIKPTP